MRRFFVSEIKPQNGLVNICGSEAKHISRVLRMCPGDSLVLMDAMGNRYKCRISSITKNNVELEIEEVLPKPSPSPVQIALAQALLKSKAMDLFIQKVTELGVNAIYPFFSARTVVKLRPDMMQSKLRHWEEIAKNATKQSDCLTPPEIFPPCSFEDLLDKWKRENCLKIILWEGKAYTNLKNILSGRRQHKKVIGIIGPEGGFAMEEIVIAEAAGFIPVSMGRRILRAETAGIVLATLTQYELGDLGVLQE